VSKATVLFEQYKQLRVDGVEHQLALKKLRPRIERLDAQEREEFIHNIKVWTSKQKQVPPLPDPKSSKATVIHPAIRRLTPEADEPSPEAAAPSPSPANEAPPEDEVSWLRCAHCGQLNRAHQTYCESCGEGITLVKDFRSTQPLSSLDEERRAHFGEHDVLMLTDAASSQVYRLQLGQHDKEIILGRNTANPNMMPDIDLTSTSEDDYGVSRLHLAIRYDRDDHTVRVTDLNSANGSAINGQKLHPQEIRILRDGDELKLGRLALQVSFQSPE